ncbi:MAG: CARDB domain-containing protein [Thermodesulfobacteriota bacterium]
MRRTRICRVILLAAILVGIGFSHSFSAVPEPPRGPGLPPKGVPELPKVTVPPVPPKPDLSIGPFNIREGFTDFYIDSPGMGPNAMTVRGQVFNWGSVEVRGFEVDVVLSKDMKVSPDDILLERIVVRDTIPPGSASRAGAVLVSSRANSIVKIPPGWYYVCVRADPRNVIAESNENNNESCSTRVEIHKAGAH